MRLRGADGRERLLSALGQPRWPRYRGVIGKAAALNYFLNKGHPFVDGNKRFAVAAMATFLAMNRVTVIARYDEIMNLALGVADGTISLQQSVGLVRRFSVPTPSGETDSDLHTWLRSVTGEQLVRVIGDSLFQRSAWWVRFGDEIGHLTDAT